MREKRVVLNDETEEVEPIQPVKRLLAAMLSRAIQDIASVDGCSDKAGEDAASARRWIRRTGVYPFSFEWVCLHLDRSAEDLRSTLNLHKPCEVRKFVRTFAGDKRGQSSTPFSVG